MKVKNFAEHHLNITEIIMNSDLSANHSTVEIVMKPTGNTESVNPSTNCVRSCNANRNEEINHGALSSDERIREVRRSPTEQLNGCYDNAPDGGWGWVVIFAAFVVGAIIDGISYSFGIFFKQLLVHFNESKSLTSWVISVFNGTYLTIGPIASILVNKFGCRRVAVFGALISSVSLFLSTFSPNIRVMILSYGLLGGAGLGLLHLPSIVIVGHYFKKKRALATGIAVCGSGIGGFVFAPLSEFLIEMYTWKGAIWIIAAIVLNGIPIGGLLRPLEGSARRKERCSQNEDETITKCCNLSSVFDIELLRSPTFIVYGIACFLFVLGGFIQLTYIPDFAKELNMTSQQGAMLISIVGILNVVARVAAGWLADRLWANTLMIKSVVLVLGGVATVFVPFYSPYWAMATYCAVLGITIGVFATYRSVILAELLGIEKLTSSFGLVSLCQGLGGYFGTPIAGALSDHAGNYRGAFYFAAAVIILAGALCLPLRAINRWETKRHESRPQRSGTLNKNQPTDVQLEITSPKK